MSAQRKDCVLQFLFSNFKTLKFQFVQYVKERIKPRKYFLLEDDPSAKKTKDFAPCNKSIMANKLLSTNKERFLRRIKSPLTR